MDQTDKWLDSEIRSESNCKLPKSNYIIDLPNFTLTASIGFLIGKGVLREENIRQRKLSINACGTGSKTTG